MTLYHKNAALLICLPSHPCKQSGDVTAGLLKVVFATETLAAGINMPARTTIISTLSRRRDVDHSALLHNEMLQMAGRAGRRGFDTAGALCLFFIRVLVSAKP